MKFKKAISAFAALAMSLSCFAGLSLTASADETKSFVATASAGETGGTITVNVAGTENDNLEDLHTNNYQNFNTGSSSIALIEFNVTGIDTTRLKSVALKFTSSGDPAANSSTMIFGSKSDVEIKADMTESELLAGYDRGASNVNQLINTWTNKGTSQIQNITDDKVQKFIMDKIKAGSGTAKIQFYISASSGRTTTITTKAGATVGDVTSIAPTIDVILYDEGSVPVNYTVQYVNDSDNGAAITGKDAATRQGIIGQPATITNDDKADFKANDNKYIYVATEADETIAALDEDASKNIIKVHFREAAKTTYTVNIKTDTTKELYKEEGFEGETVEVPFERHILEGNTLYTTDEYKKGGSWGKKSITYTAEDKTDTIEYTAQTGTYVYASEGENLEGASKGSGNYANSRASNGAVGYSSTPLTLITLPAGTYQITAQVYGNTKEGEERAAKFYAGETLVLTAAMAGNPTEYTSEEFKLESPTVITATSWGGSAGGIDDIVIKRTAAPTPVSNETTSAVLTAEQVTAAGLGPVAEATETVAVPTAVTVDAPVFGATQISAYTVKTIKYVVTNPDTLAATEAVLKVGDTTVNTWKGEYDAATGEKTYYAQFAVPTNAEAASYSKFGTVTASYGTAKIATYNLATDAVTFAAPAAN